MIKIGGEIALKIKKVSFSKEIMDACMYNEPCIDMTLRLEDGDLFYICGNNDWGYLMADALKPLMKYANDIEDEIREHIAEYGTPEVIGLGKNEYRAIEISHTIKSGKEVKALFVGGVQMVRLNRTVGIKYFEDTDYGLPFE